MAPFIIWANGTLACVRIKGATRQRGLKLILRDLGKVWVSGLGPWSRPLQATPYASEGPHPIRVSFSFASSCLATLVARCPYRCTSLLYCPVVAPLPRPRIACLSPPILFRLSTCLLFVFCSYSLCLVSSTHRHSPWLSSMFLRSYVGCS